MLLEADRATQKVQISRTSQVRNAFGSRATQKSHAAVARSKFGNQHVKSTPGLERLPLEVELLKKCARFCREARFEDKMLKAPHVRTTFGGSSAF